MGKRGTAQKYEDGRVAQGKYVASFIGVYPTRSPKYIMIITIDEPSAGAYYGGVVAAPVGQRVFSEIFTSKNIMPDNKTDATDIDKIVMPYVIGLPLAEAAAKIKEAGLVCNIQGEGDYVLAQYPQADSRLTKYTEVAVQTN